MRTHPRALTSMAIVVASIAWLSCRSHEPPAKPSDPVGLQAAVDTLLVASAEAWNAGELDGFLEWYRRSPETTYIGSSGLVRGWEAIRARYAPLFEPGAARDWLRFEGLAARPLGPNLGLATARYVLVQGDSVTATGIFTLIVRREPEGWRIVHDHSSALPLQP